MKSPNILLIITDQQSLDTISAYRNYFKDDAYAAQHLKTPNIDRLVKGGYSFILSNSVNPVSCPGRGSIFTGRNAIEHGITYNNIGIDKNVQNLGQWLSVNSEYECYYCGKWHAGGQWNYPTISGNRKIPGFTTIPISEFALGENNDYHVSTAVKCFLADKENSSPFFLVAGLMNPHDICYWTPQLNGKKKNLVSEDSLEAIKDDYAPLPPNYKYSFDEPARLKQTRMNLSDQYWKNYRYDYFRMVEKADLDIGRILDAVEQRNDDTIVIFTSDHGEGCGRHSRVQKWHPYEESVKVPLIFYAPKRIRHQVDVHTLVTGLDIFPTICGIAGIETPEHMRGVNLYPMMSTGEKAPQRNYIVSEFQITGRIVMDGRYKYVQMYEFSGQQDLPFVRKSDGMAEQFVPGKGDSYKVDPVIMLFDLEKDPWEQKNVINQRDYIKEVKRLQGYLKEWEDMIIPGKHYDRN